MLRTLSLALALAMSLALPNITTAHDYYGGGWRDHGWDHTWGYGGVPGWRHGWARPYGYGGGYYGGGDCWRWIDGDQVWVC